MELATLDKLIPQYAANKREKDSYEKICNAENAEIKAIMRSFVVQKYTAGGYNATYSIQNRETIDEEAMLEILKESGITNVVKTKEYIDFDALENVIYHNLIPDDVLQKLNTTKSVKRVEVLKITKAKEKKE